jgi:dTDP-glucose pyrophosphorylase
MSVINLIPMAGEGNRFKERGYLTPKPLIKIEGLPMIIRALGCLPKAQQNILIVRSDLIDVDVFKKSLDKHFSNVIIIEINKLTEGQASTCLVAEDYIPSNSIINIGACDIGVEFEMKRYNDLLKSYGSFIWTYNNNKNVISNPEMYGWVKSNSIDEVEYVSCKKPISNDLLNDNVVSGIFTFKNSSSFFQAIKKMINKNDRVNNEFYIDNIFNHLDHKSGILKLEKFSSWGTPDELEDYIKNE